jgi:type IV secretory pathway VirB9-like protein
MLRRAMIRIAATSAALLVLMPALAFTQDGSFITLHFAEQRQFDVRCPANYECEIQLQKGERVSDGFNAHINDWDPHIGYTGEGVVTPHLMLRPVRSGLRTNIVLTTTKRTYHLLATSDASDTPRYYSFVYDDQMYRPMSRAALAAQAALRARAMASPVPTATPADVAELKSVCIDYDYGYFQDFTVPADHMPGTQASHDSIPQDWIPRVMCTDGKHTYIDFPIGPEQPYDTPTFHAVLADGDEIINAVYNGARRRFILDGVYPDIVLQLGSMVRPLRIRLVHFPSVHNERGHAKPIQIPRPADA